MRYSWNELHRFASQCFQVAGVPPADAEWTAEVLVRADFTGVHTHGLSRLSAYIQGIRRGVIKAAPDTALEKRALSVATLDGDSGLGPVVAKLAMEAAVDLAKETGIGIVTVKRGNHAGPLSAYIDLATQAEMIGWAFSNAQPAIPPWGGRKAFFGTNPIAFGAPTHCHSPVVLDMATSKVARGNIILAAKTGQSIPEDWAIDETGCPTTDAQAALRGAVLPMAGPKGYALALMVEILSGVLSGAEMAPHVGSMYDKEQREPGTGLCCIAINPRSFFDGDEFYRRMDVLVDEIHQVPPADGFSSVRIPGERRVRLEHQGRQEGIALEQSTLDELKKLAEELHIAWRDDLFV
ncbi:Ldh family oxidoreductase [Fodinisporobacter ferrooxydans]|uniref:Ldh family oxidoreductase n=1 Tax=Fodinisporobacter ferrooxydans TaxID=2901836 RepID=A0ABY4CQM8_9BACL|nr:Ldh family oxidoreductase [Alicyclobacillaceae bacterium MYW30-H2]